MTRAKGQGYMGVFAGSSSGKRLIVGCIGAKCCETTAPLIAMLAYATESRRANENNEKVAMHPAARIAAAIEVLEDLETRRRPAADSLKDWGLAHRFAGSKDRSAIASLVFDALRRRASARWMMNRRGRARGNDRRVGARAFASGEEIETYFSGLGHAPAPLDADERQNLFAADLSGAPDWVRGDFPEWLAPHFARAFGDRAVEEGRALAARAPLDLRVNLLKATRAEILAELAHLSPVACAYRAAGVRIAQGAGGRAPALAAEPAYVRGLVEVQDEGSQIAARIARAAPGEQVSTSVRAAAARPRHGRRHGQSRPDLRHRHGRTAPYADFRPAGAGRRAQCPGARAARPTGRSFADLVGACDLVLIDAPCTRRRHLATQSRRQMADAPRRAGAAHQGADGHPGPRGHIVKPGGRLVYVTCSLLCEENEDP